MRLTNHNRQSIRLAGFNYSQPGVYFITLVAHTRENLFGEIKNGGMRLNEYGEIVKKTWNDLPNHVGNIALDEFTIMPNHVHGIIMIVGAGSKPAHAGPVKRAGFEPPLTVTKKKHALPEIIRQYKTFSARRINQIRKTPGQTIWQRNYYEHVVRDENDLFGIRKYVRDNPVNWESDEENAVNASPRYVAMPNPQRRHFLVS